MGAGQGFAQGVQSLTNSLMAAYQLHNQSKYYDAIGEVGKQQQEYDAYKQLHKDEFQRGENGLLPAYQEQEAQAAAAQAAATRPEIPSSTPTITPGPLGFPRTQFPVGGTIQPMPAAPAPNPALSPKPGAFMLPGMRPRLPMMGRRPPMLRNFRFGR